MLPGLRMKIRGVGLVTLTLPEPVFYVIDFLPKVWPRTSKLGYSCPQLMLLTLPQYGTDF